jgi:hypothetical protein
VAANLRLMMGLAGAGDMLRSLGSQRLCWTAKVTPQTPIIEYIVIITLPHRQFAPVVRGALVPVGEGYRSLKSNRD